MLAQMNLNEHWWARTRRLDSASHAMAPIMMARWRRGFLPWSLVVQVDNDDVGSSAASASTATANRPGDVDGMGDRDVSALVRRRSMWAI